MSYVKIELVLCKGFDTQCKGLVKTIFKIQLISRVLGFNVRQAADLTRFKSDDHPDSVG